MQSLCFRFSLMSGPTREGTAEPVSRDQNLRQRENLIFPLYSADHEQEWQPYLVDPYSAESPGRTYYIIIIHTVHSPPAS